jgi:hypothetical protein
MTKKEIVEKVKKYLDKANIKYFKESLDYLAFKENGLVRDGSRKSMHLVTYDLDFKSDFPIKHTVFLDDKDLSLMYIVTPHGYIEIED